MNIKRLIVLVLALMLMTTAPVTAGKQSGAKWFGPSWNLAESVVEQQSIGGCCGSGPRVLNPDYFVTNGCAWDADDQLFAHVSGDYIDPGVTVTGTMCLYADWMNHLVGWKLNYPGLTGSITLPGHIILPITTNGCIAGPRYSLTTSGTTDTPIHAPSEWSYSPFLTEINNSNGGVGKVTIFTFSVTNSTSRRIRNNGNSFADAHLALAGYSPAAAWANCPYPMTSVGIPLYESGHDPQVWIWTP